MPNQRWQGQRVTIKDIARKARVDPSTVTRALQGSLRVKQSTREAIAKLATDMGYVPSVAARTLVMKRSQLVGVVIPDMTNPFFADLVRGIEDEAGAHRLRTLMRNTEGRQDAERDAVNLFTELEVDGLLVPMARCPQEFYASLHGSVPVIHVNRDDAPHHVSCDSSHGTLLLMQHLLEHRHRCIAFVNGPSGPAREPKMSAYRQALARAAIAYDERLLFQFDGTLQSTETIARQIVAAKPRPTAVFAWNDVCAIGLIHALHSLDVRTPEDISVAGHDDIEMAGRVLPPITTVRWPMYELGVESVRYLMNLRAGIQPQTPAIPMPSLVVRESTGPSPRGNGA